MAIHKDDQPGDILIFLTGQDECEAGRVLPFCRFALPGSPAYRHHGGAESPTPARAAGKHCCPPVFQAPALATACPALPGPAAVKLLEEEGRHLQRSRLKWRLQPVALYAGLPATHQLAVFEPAARGVRKVGAVMSTCGCVWVSRLAKCMCCLDGHACQLHDRPACRSSLPLTLLRLQSHWRASCT